MSLRVHSIFTSTIYSKTAGEISTYTQRYRLGVFGILRLYIPTFLRLCIDVSSPQYSFFQRRAKLQRRHDA